MRRLPILLLSWWLLASAAHAADAPARRTAWLGAQVTIDADGHVRDLDWDTEGNQAAEFLVRRIDPRVRAWEFEPATANALPVATTTGLLVQVVLEPTAEGGMTLWFGGTYTGPLRSRFTPPRYPPGALYSKAEAFLDVDVSIGADGGVTIEAIAVRGKGGQETSFKKAVREAAAHWRFAPELIDGRAVATRVRVPVSFCIEERSSWCAKQRAATPDASPDGQGVALEPRVKLKTDIRAQAI